MNRKLTLIAITATLIGMSACTPQEIADAVASQAAAPAAAPPLPWVYERQEATPPFNIIMRVAEDDDGWRVLCQSVYSGTPSMVPTSEAVTSDSDRLIPVCLDARSNS